VLRAQAGSRADINNLLTIANDKAAEMQGKSQETTGTTSVWAAAVQGLAADYTKTLEMLDANKTAAELAADSAARGEEQNRDQIQRTRDAAQSRYEAMAAQYSNPLTVKLRLDSSEVDNYSPAAKFATVFYTPAPGAGIMKWDQ